MLKRNFATMTVLMALSALVVTGCYHTPEQRAEHFVKKMASELNLNEMQTAQLEKIKDEFLAKRPEMAKLRRETIQEANELMKSPEIDQAKLNALIEKNTTGADDFVRFVFAKFTEIHDMLTPAQRDKLVAHIEKYMDHGGMKSGSAKPASMGGSY